MAKLLPTLVLTLLILVLNFLACGGTPSRQLLSVAVAPQTATASDPPNGIVQLTATGTYDRAPSPTAVNPANWDLVPSSAYPADAVSFNASGIAQCKAGFVGTVTVRGGVSLPY